MQLELQMPTVWKKLAAKTMEPDDVCFDSHIIGLLFKESIK